jgi:hypothetical protein
MKLAEALVLRADTQKRVEQLRERLTLSVVVQEGEQPPEDPQALLTEIERLLNQLNDLIARINRTNIQTTLENGINLTEALAQRDVLRMHYCILKSAADIASQRQNRYSYSEIRQVAMVDVAALRQRTDDLARQHRELDTAIQGINWTTELVT